MEIVEHRIGDRLYSALSDGNGNHIIQGPPEGLVDELGLPEPTATNLHNALYRRRLFSYEEISRRPQELQGAWQEALQVDVQKLTEAYFRFSGGST